MSLFHNLLSILGTCVSLIPGGPQVNLGFLTFPAIDKDGEPRRSQHRACAGDCGITKTNKTHWIWSQSGHQVLEGQEQKVSLCGGQENVTDQVTS